MFPGSMAPRIAFASLLTTLCVMGGGRHPARAQDAAPSPPGISIASEIDMNSRYVWRGIAFSQGTVYQPSVTLARGTWSLGFWSNVDRNVITGPSLDELDVTLGTSATWHGWTVGPSALLYAYPPGVGVPATGELQLEIGRTYGRWSPYVRHSVDVVQAKGAAYSALGISLEQVVREHVTIAANAEYGRGWLQFASLYDPALKSMNVLSGGLSVSVPLVSGVTLRPHACWNQVANRQVRDWISGPTPFGFGMALGREF